MENNGFKIRLQGTPSYVELIVYLFVRFLKISLP